MKFLPFLKDKLYIIISWLFVYIFILLLFFAFSIHFVLIVMISLFLFSYFVLILLIEYLRKRKFYCQLLEHIKELDQSYLVLETIDPPSFYEGELVTQMLYEINKSMNENVTLYKQQMDNFKEYVELWVHEVKIPLSSLTLMMHNHPSQYDKKLMEQLRRIENNVEQVLYYVRAENAEKDYLINEVSLDKVIAQVALKNKDDFLENGIEFIVKCTNILVYTDSKWLTFIVSQIINNSIKYRKENEKSRISIEVIEKNDFIMLIIEDNGMGIPASDLPRVFEKSFTGQNGREKLKSTGMGLFLAKNMCQKLGHLLSIESIEGEYTKVFLTFDKNHYFDVIK